MVLIHGDVIHGDRVNRNILAHEDRIAGVFDWGCSRYGACLYNLAWFEFWAIWFPQLNMPFLHAELARRWQEAGYALADKAERLLACYLHIGLDHLGYYAHLSNWSELATIVAHLQTLVQGL